MEEIRIYNNKFDISNLIYRDSCNLMYKAPFFEKNNRFSERDCVFIYELLRRRLVSDEDIVKFKELIGNWQKLKLSGRKNKGKRTAILCSNTDGMGRHSQNESRIFQEVGDGYHAQQSPIMAALFDRTRKSCLFRNATSGDLATVVQDPQFKI